VFSGYIDSFQLKQAIKALYQAFL